MLLPSSLQDWMPKDHLACFIGDTVDVLNLKALCVRCEGGGSCNQPFHPVMMVKVLVYGSLTGVFSSRKFKRRQHEHLAGLFVQLFKLAQEMGLVRLGTVAIDGSKIKANASPDDKCRPVKNKAGPLGVATSANPVCPSPRRRTTLPTRKVAS